IKGVHSTGKQEKIIFSSDFFDPTEDSLLFMRLCHVDMFTQKSKVATLVTPAEFSGSTGGRQAATNIVCTMFTTNVGIILLFRKNKKVIIHMITPIFLRKNMYWLPLCQTIQPARKQAPNFISTD
ncbi:hypothetical protein ACJX0J_031417, partial [Zea mays]